MYCNNQFCFLAMNKKIKNLFLAGALVLGLAGVAVSCTDYDDDISKLEQEVNTLTKTVNDLQARINAGAVITSVVATPAGDGYVVTLSDGQSFTIKHGEKGEPGEAGPRGPQGEKGDTPVISIGDNGNWFVDGVDTGKAAQGPAGKDGKDGVDGKDGKDGEDGADGKDGKDGVWYTPETDGYWYLHTTADTDPKGTKTEDMWLLPGILTAVWADDALTIYGVKDAEGNLLDPIKIVLSQELTSLVFIPQVYVDGVEGMVSSIFTYNPLEVSELDTKSEVWSADNAADGAEAEEGGITLSPGLYAEYHVNPTNAKVTGEEEYSFVIDQNGNVPFHVTRAQASEDFDVIPTFNKVENGILKVDVEIVGRPATADFISVVALKVATGDTAVVSDYATVFEENIPDLVIANKKAVSTLYKQGEVDEEGNYDQHYRTILGEEDAEAKVITAAPWSENYNVEECDTTVAADGSIDLLTIVAAHSVDTDAEKSDADLENLGLTWDFSLVKYVWGEPEVNEADYAVLEGSVLKPNPAKGNAVTGHTPIVRVKLMNGENVVKVAYIKIMFGPSVTELKPVCVEGKNEFDFNCEETVSRDSVTLADMTANIYEKVGMTEEEFNALYVNFEDISEDVAKIEDEDSLAALHATNVADELILGEVFLNEDNLIVWTIPMDEVWENSGKDVVKYAKYTSESGLEFFVRLTAVIAPIPQTFYMTGFKEGEEGAASDNKINEYWKNMPYKNVTYYNVQVPDPVGTDSPDGCLFHNNINSSFVTDAEGKTIVWKNGETAGEHLRDANGKLVEETNIDGLDFFFCKENDGVVVKGCYNGETGEYEDVQLVYVEGDSLNLYAKVVGDEEAEPELIATISNDDDELNNVMDLLKDSKLAKELLNTNRLKVFVGATGFYCGDENKQVTILFDEEGEWKDHFVVKYVIPVIVETVSEGNFIDGVDMGQVGSYIDVAKLIHPMDWRFRRFTPATDEAVDGVDYYSNYWGYYGPFKVEIDTDVVNCDLNNPADQKGDPQYGHLKPTTIILDTEDNGWNGIESEAAQYIDGPAFLTYKNNGNKVEDFNLFVQFRIQYGWGYIDPANTVITIPVVGTGGTD